MNGRPDPPPAVRWITRRLEEAGHETWAVGGAVRDACLGHRTGDWDLATHATPKQVRRIFKRTVPIGVEHGTVGVLARDGTMYEVTTFRRDVETDGRHAVVQFAETLEEDLARRDFTINAIAWHALREELYDPFDGLGDLERGVLRTVGDPGARFSEDYLRILRAFRFAGRFSLELEGATWSAASERVDRLPRLSAERIRDELLKVLGADPRPTRALGLYADSGALAAVAPELEALRRSPGRGSYPSGWALAVAAVSHLPVERPLLRLAGLLRPAPGEEVAALLLRLRLSNAQVDRVARLAAAEPLPAADASDEAVRRWLAREGPGRVSAVARLDMAEAWALHGAERSGGAEPPEVSAVVASWRRARAVRAAAPPLTVSDLAIDGRGLIALGLRPGPHFGRILDQLLDWVLEDPARNDTGRLAARVVELEEGAPR